MKTSTRGHVQELPTVAVTAQDEIDDSALAVLTRLNQHGPGAVPEQNTGRPIVEINNRCHDVGADHEDFVMGSGRDELRGGGKRVYEAGAGAGKIETPRSEEHTSELQSPCNLVCRLLLEKKKTST